MSEPFFPEVERVVYGGPDTDEPFAFRHYEPDRVVAGRTMREHLRLAVCYWHTFCWPGSDVFGDGTFDRPWLGDGEPLALAERKLEVAFEFFEKLGAPFFTFHDRDLAPEGATRDARRQPCGTWGGTPYGPVRTRRGRGRFGKRRVPNVRSGGAMGGRSRDLSLAGECFESDPGDDWPGAAAGGTDYRG